MNLSAEWTSMTDFANKPPVLDLKAVEAEAQHVEAGIYPARAVMLAEKTLALLALLRETRAALADFKLSGHCKKAYHLQCQQMKLPCACCCHSGLGEQTRAQYAAAVLAKATEGQP